MKKIFSIVLVILGLTMPLQAQTNELETLLFELPDVSFKKIETAENFTATYELQIKQPVDHENPSKGYFHQRVFLSHQGFDQPTVLITEGYDRPRNRINELTKLLNGNQLQVEHRYFGTSSPKEMDYQHLNLTQVAKDLHHIKELFKTIYKKQWLATGRSKGGATTLFYRYFYPEDVDVSVNYVGPINNAFEDQRIYKFLDTVGTKSCRDKIKSFQRHLLKNRKSILPLLKVYNLATGNKYTYHSFEEAYEYAVMEYPFSFWQYGQSCEDIPDTSVSALGAMKYLNKVADMSFFSDGPTVGYAPHYYQSATEFGYYGYETSEFKGLIKALPTDRNPHAAFTPDKQKVPFNGELLDKINAWLPENGHRIIHIYGSLDTWSATAVPPSSKVDAVWFMMEGKHHGNASIKTMSPTEKKKLKSTLERWLDIKIEAKKLK